MLCNKIDLAFVLGLLAFVHGMPADSQSNERVSIIHFRKYYQSVRFLSFIEDENVTIRNEKIFFDSWNLNDSSNDEYSEPWKINREIETFSRKLYIIILFLYKRASFLKLSNFVESNVTLIKVNNWSKLSFFIGTTSKVMRKRKERIGIEKHKV